MADEKSDQGRSDSDLERRVAELEEHVKALQGEIDKVISMLQGMVDIAGQQSAALLNHKEALEALAKRR